MQIGGLDTDCDVVDAGHHGIGKARLIAALNRRPDSAGILIESDPDKDMLVDVRFVELNNDIGDGNGYYARRK
jgi:hypothetical protein